MENNNNTPTSEENKEVQGITLSDDLFKELEQDLSEQPTTTTSQDAPDMATGIYNVLLEKNAIPAIENFDGKLETLDEALNKLPEYYRNKVVESLPPVAKSLFEYAASLSENATLEELSNFFSNVREKVSVESVDVSNADSARSFLENDYKNLLPDATDEEINTLLDSLESSNRLIDKASKRKEALLLEKKAKEQEELNNQRLNKERAETEARTFSSKVIELVNNNKEFSPRVKSELLSQFTGNKLQELMDTIQSSPELFVHFLRFGSRIKDGKYIEPNSSQNNTNNSNLLRNFYSDKFKSNSVAGGFQQQLNMQNNGLKPASFKILS